MSKLREQVLEFHRLYGQPIAETPSVPSNERLQLRLNLIAEEFLELLEACGAIEDDVENVRMALDEAICWTPGYPTDLVEVADALGDLDYVVEGMRIECGIDGDPVADEIHRSNLSKLGADGKPVRREDGKITKGPNYSPPDIEAVLIRQGMK